MWKDLRLDAGEGEYYTPQDFKLVFLSGALVLLLPMQDLRGELLCAVAAFKEEWLSTAEKQPACSERLQNTTLPSSPICRVSSSAYL